MTEAKFTFRNDGSILKVETEGTNGSYSEVPATNWQATATYPEIALYDGYFTYDTDHQNALDWLTEAQYNALGRNQ